MNRLSIIDETVEYYKHNPRAFCGYDGCCQYWMAGGAMCAVGRCLIDPKEIEENIDESGGVNQVWEDDATMDVDLKPEYRGMGRKFWSELQSLHDDGRNWNEDGSLTDDGKIAVSVLKERWK